MCVGVKMAEISSANMDSITDSVAVLAYARSSISASSSTPCSLFPHSATYESIKGHHYQGCCNQLNVTQRR